MQADSNPHHESGLPRKAQTFGEHLRKARMDAGLRIKELAAIVGATEDSVINWELRGVRPTAPFLRKVIDFIQERSRGHVMRQELTRLLFLDDPGYPAEVKTLGDRLRATRMGLWLVSSHSSGSMDRKNAVASLSHDQ